METQKEKIDSLGPDTGSETIPDPGDAAAAVNIPDPEGIAPAAEIVPDPEGLAPVTQKEKFFTTKKIVVIAVMTALSYVLYAFLKFPLPFFPGFLDFQISDVPVLIAGFLYGPLVGLIVLILKIVLKILTVGTSSSGVGELGDLIIGAVFLVVSYFIYATRRTKKTAVIGLSVGTVLSTVAAIIINRVMLIPFYIVALFEGNWERFLGMFRGLYPSITKQNFYTIYIFAATLPFNLMRGILSAVVTFFAYKGISNMLKLNFKKVSAKKRRRRMSNI